MLIVFLRQETSCDLHSGAGGMLVRCCGDDGLSQTACHLQRRQVGGMTAALGALICSRASGVLSCTLREALHDERSLCPRAEGDNWRIGGKVQGLRSDVLISREWSPDRCWGWLIWPLLQVGMCQTSCGWPWEGHLETSEGTGFSSRPGKPLNGAEVWI